MQIFITVKRMGKSKPALTGIPYEISDSVISDGRISLRAFLKELVRIEVERYLEKGVDRQVIPYLTAEEVEAGAAAGKVGFARIYSEQKPHLEQAHAQENALQCFTDGLVRVFQNETELTELDGKMELKAGDTFTLIRFTFLAGRLW